MITHALDGSEFGPLFQKLLKYNPEIENLSTNRLSLLTNEELIYICSKYRIEFDSNDDRRDIAQKIASKLASDETPYGFHYIALVKNSYDNDNKLIQQIIGIFNDESFIPEKYKQDKLYTTQVIYVNKIIPFL